MYRAGDVVNWKRGRAVVLCDERGGDVWLEGGHLRRAHELSLHSRASNRRRWRQLQRTAASVPGHPSAMAHADMRATQALGLTPTNLSRILPLLGACALVAAQVGLVLWIVK